MTKAIIEHYDDPEDMKVVLGEGISVGLVVDPSGRKFVGVSVLMNKFALSQIGQEPQLVDEDHVYCAFALNTESDLNHVISMLERYRDDITPLN